MKPVTPLSVEILRTLPAQESETESRLEEAVRWILDDGCYAGMQQHRPATTRQVPRAKLDVADVTLMHEAGQLKEVNLEFVRGYVQMFAVPELAKRRRRVIKHTRAINDAFDRRTILPVRQPTRAQQSAQAASGAFALTLDFAAFFDQFEIAATIQRRMCFRSGGRVWALTRMPMGQRHAVAVAQCATDKLLSFAYPAGVTAQSCIDNVRFVGSRLGVIEAARIFVDRCRKVGATLNELSAQDDVKTALERLVHQEGDWLGAVYDYKTAKQKVAVKSVDKLRLSWNRRQRWTHRQYAAHMGLLFFCASVLRMPLAGYFEALKQLRRRSSDLAANEELWEQPVEVAPGEWDALSRWTATALKNEWVPCDNGAKASKFIITDASGWGWGALCFDERTGATTWHSQEWSAADRRRIDTDASTRAEPEGVLQALRRFCWRGERGPVAVLTDSTTAKYALTKGYSASFEVNAIVARVKAEFPLLQLHLHHIAGTANPADGLSRNAEGWDPASADELARRCIEQADNGVAAGRRDLGVMRSPLLASASGSCGDRL